MEFGLPPAKAPTDIDRHVGLQVRVRRLASGMSQEQLAKVLQVSFQQLQKYENGTNRISAGRLAQVARALGVPVETFFEEVEGQQGDPAAKAGFSAFLNDPDGARLALAWGNLGPQVRARLVGLVDALATPPARHDGDEGAAHSFDGAGRAPPPRVERRLRSSRGRG